MYSQKVKERIKKVKPYLDFIINNRNLLDEIYPKGVDLSLNIEFILAQKPYSSYAYYRLIKSIVKSPCRKIILIIDKNLLTSSLSLFRAIILSTIFYFGLVKIFIYDENDYELNIRALKSSENYFWNYFKRLGFANISS